jgi:phosphatidylethanolamine/phosphatidyl-N-methylethanolamine N-methyltransferase
LRPDGTLALINHFRSENPVLGGIDRALEPLTRYWGWHTLRRDEVFHSLPVEIDRVYKTRRLSLFTIVIARNRKNGASGEDAGPAAAGQTVGH